MRLIGKLSSSEDARAFRAYLEHEGISVQCEQGKTANEWLVWIVEEDRVQEAASLYHQFLENRDEPRFKLALERDKRNEALQRAQEESRAEVGRQEVRHSWISSMGKVTFLLMALCTILLIWGQVTAPKPSTREGGDSLFRMGLLLSPPYRALLFDYPPQWETLYQLSQKYTLQELDTPSQLPAPIRKEVNALHYKPIFHGFYDFLLEKIRAPASSPEIGPMFVKIRQGEVWRLFTPALLHGSLLHLFVNLLWMLILGNQVEHRLGVWRYLLFVLATGTLSNIAQYLVSGPAFLGISGVVVALFGFVWMRQKLAPWEGYRLNRATIIFVNLFIFGMVALQAVSFILQVMGGPAIAEGIANTAHLVGLASGVALGRTKIFSYRLS